MKESYLSMRLHDDYNCIVDAICAAWNKVTNEAGRIKSLCDYPWIERLVAATIKT